MADEPRSRDQILGRIHAERSELADAVEALRAELREAADVGSKVRARLPLYAAGSLASGFVLAGGARATLRLLLRRHR